MTSPEIYPALVLLLLVILGLAALVALALILWPIWRGHRANRKWAKRFGEMTPEQRQAGVDRLLAAIIEQQAELTDESLARAVEGWQR